MVIRGESFEANGFIEKLFVKGAKKHTGKACSEETRRHTLSVCFLSALSAEGHVSSFFTLPGTFRMFVSLIYF
jgi:hypothetical protein